MMKEKSYKTLKGFDQTTYKHKIKRNMWNITNISEHERRSEIDSAVSVLCLELPSTDPIEEAKDIVWKVKKL